MPTSDLPILPFPTPVAMAGWLEKHHATSPGIWIRFFKKDSGTPSVTRVEAIDVALCYGWIDSQLKSHDEQSWLHKFTPRKSRSMWSKRNIERVGILIKEKRMQPAGLKEVKAAKADGRWERAYDKPSDMKVPKDFLRALKQHKKAFAFFQSLTKANTYAIAWRLQTAKKPETRARRMEQLLGMMKEGKKLH